MSVTRTAIIVLALTAASCLAAGALPNASFEQGDTAPEGWKLEGKGAWDTTGRTGQRAVSVTGTGNDSSYWRTTSSPFAPGQLYRLSFWAKADRTTGGCVVSGPSFCNRDFRAKDEWQRNSFVFIAPAKLDADAYVRFGQWHVGATVSFDDIELVPTQAVHQRFGDIALGAGERVSGTSYTFEAPLRGEGANYSRPLASFACGFNSSRWVFYDGAHVVYRHAIVGHKQTAASVEINSGYYVSGRCTIDASTDGAKWTRIGQLAKAETVRVDVPAALLPADVLWVRLSGTGKEKDNLNSKPGNFQIHDYRYSATLDADLGNLYGATAFPQIQAVSPDFPVTILSFPAAAGAGEQVCRLEVTNRTAKPTTLRIRATATDEAGGTERSGVTAHVPPGAIATATLPCALRRAGTNTIGLSVTRGRTDVYRATATREVAMLHDATYGYALPADTACALWWCEGTYKVSRSRAVPTATATGIDMSAARNEYEPAQLVLRPKAELHNLRVRVSPLTSKQAAIGTDHIRVDRVAYVEVKRPTDRAGVRGWWPDPLPPFEQGATLEPGLNHPLWITVYVPSDQAAGEYHGTIELTADGWAATVPLRLRVWDYTLPKMSALQTGFGLSIGNIRRYHNIEGAEDLRKVVDLYHQNFAAHRIAPYDPAPLDHIKVDFGTGPWDGGRFDTTDPKQGKRCLRVEDNDNKSCTSAHNKNAIAVDASNKYRFSWWVKTAKANQRYLVTLQQYDADDQWISGNNMDFLRTGTGKWQREEAMLPAARPFNPRAKSVRLSLRPCPYSDKGEATGVAWFDDVRLELAAGGQNLMTDGGFETTVRELTAKVDFSAWDKATERTLGELGFNAFRYTLRGMGGGTFHSRRKGRIGGYEQGTPEYEKLMASQGRQVVDHFKAKGWLDRAYMYWFDEPAPKDYEFVADGMQLIKRTAPGLTRMLTEQPEEGLTGHVDLWCPVVSAVSAETIAERKAHGERFWWYLCCGPRAPYIGLFVDHPAVDLRVWAWLSRKWGVGGQLVWTSNYWTSSCAFPRPDVQNPWTDPMSYVAGYDRPPGFIGYWGNGDGRFVYPPNRDIKNDRKEYVCGPVNSVRWELLREGIEDYDMFALLDTLIAQAEAAGKAKRLVRRAKALAVVPDDVITSDKVYSKDPRTLHAHRAKVAAMVERLSRALR